MRRLLQEKRQPFRARSALYAAIPIAAAAFVAMPGGYEANLIAAVVASALAVLLLLDLGVWFVSARYEPARARALRLERGLEGRLLGSGGSVPLVTTDTVVACAPVRVQLDVGRQVVLHGELFVERSAYRPLEPGDRVRLHVRGLEASSYRSNAASDIESPALLIADIEDGAVQYSSTGVRSR